VPEVRAVRKAVVKKIRPILLGFSRRQTRCWPCAARENSARATPSASPTAWAGFRWRESRQRQTTREPKPGGLCRVFECALPCLAFPSPSGRRMGCRSHNPRSGKWRRSPREAAGGGVEGAF
jgi:hypothetical protein